MKLVLPLLALALLAGCITPQVTQSAGKLVTPATAVGRNPSWTPTAEEIAAIEKDIAVLLANPDQRVFGLGQTLPPHPFSEYIARFTAAGPLDNKFIMGLAAIPSTVPRDEFLAASTSDAHAVEISKAPQNFQFIYNLKQKHLVEIRFNKQPAQP
ncbi:hypothetical protein CMV30_01915 [Nibricoccus aquaticus]|uniref:Lipoprotein n=1 Tax=Nibricoccus aquaticus TaxID=2576891 RepID=A0A290Q3E9_9BACT|nr:hypothetical protein [Nibricoccus aquaticus]ATC62817.1 hypothetical protein CMV30_01915 [Nibricoccus aquaticus]